MVTFTTKMSHTALHGSVRGWSSKPGIAPKATTTKITLSIGTLTALLTATRAHWWPAVTLVTNQWYTSVSASSLATSARMDAIVMRQRGASTAANSGPSVNEASDGARAAHCRYRAMKTFTPAAVSTSARAARLPSALCTTSRKVNV